MEPPKFLEDEAFQALRAGELEAYHKAIAGREKVDFSETNLRGVDLRKADLSKVTLRGAYLRDADLRGIDLRDHDLEGCSIRHAHISGTLFPADLAAAEILMSLQYGTRMRTGRQVPGSKTR